MKVLRRMFRLFVLIGFYTKKSHCFSSVQPQMIRDYIALQAGDTVPGNCFPLSATAEYISSGNHPSTSSLLTYGSKLPPISHGSHPINHNHNVPPPTPYTTNTRSNPCWDPYFASKEMLMADSTKLIHLCNNMRIFIMDETPMDRFLKNHSPGILPQYIYFFLIHEFISLKFHVPPLLLHYSTKKNSTNTSTSLGFT